MSFKPSDKAIEQAISDLTAGGDTESAPAFIEAALKAARRALFELTDYPEEDKEALAATMALSMGRDFALENSLPPNLDEYGPRVKALLSERLQDINAGNMPGNPDLKNIALAEAVLREELVPYSISSIQEIMNGMKDSDAFEKLRPAIDAQVELMKRESTPDLDAHMTGTQPRLEAQARKSVRRLQMALNAAFPELKTPDNGIPGVDVTAGELTKLTKTVSAPKAARFTKRVP